MYANQIIMNVQDNPSQAEEYQEVDHSMKINNLLPHHFE